MRGAIAFASAFGNNLRRGTGLRNGSARHDAPFPCCRCAHARGLRRCLRAVRLSVRRARRLHGALIGYGADFVHMYRRAPFYVARVLKGTAPADLPVEQPSHIELAVNLNTAKTLRLELPLSLLVRANNLIE
jgi:ABC transporter substrate binding protein